MVIRELEDRMRRAEWFHSLRVPDGSWVVLRMDGRCFSKVTKDLEHPFDENFNHAMVTTAQEVFKELGGIYGETHSDEISILLQPDTEMFDREVEKLVSISASLASAHFTRIRHEVCTFDSRVVMLPDTTEVANYFYWRQSDANRCCLNSWCYWKLRERGCTPRQAHATLEGLNHNVKNSMLMEQFSINYTTDIPTYQKCGVGLYWNEMTREGFNPLTQETEVAQRRELFTDVELPYGPAYYIFIERNVIGCGPGNKWCFKPHGGG
jgi:tRNA(His) guanylyltransferase